MVFVFHDFMSLKWSITRLCVVEIVKNKQIIVHLVATVYRSQFVVLLIMIVRTVPLHYVTATKLRNCRTTILLSQMRAEMRSIRISRLSQSAPSFPSDIICRSYR